MLETIWWFIFKDSRASVKFLYDRSTQTLIAHSIVSISLIAVFLAFLDYDAIFSNNTNRFIFSKFMWEILTILFILPFLVTKSAERHVFRADRPEERYSIGLYLRSRTFPNKPVPRARPNPARPPFPILRLLEHCMEFRRGFGRRPMEANWLGFGRNFADFHLRGFGGLRPGLRLRFGGFADQASELGEGVLVRAADRGKSYTVK